MVGDDSRQAGRGGDAYLPELDGLRGIAITLVVLFHAGVPGFRTGAYLGVDLFFVLSGFLITTTILREREATGRLDLLAFYARRWLRLFPALLAVCLALTLAMAIQPDRLQILRDQAAALGYIANWTRAFELGTPRYLGHTWSLAIEEQFYLAWPLVLLAALRWGGVRAAFRAALGLAVLVMLWRLWSWHGGMPAIRIYNGTDTRLDGLFLGCALALGLAAPGGVRRTYPHRLPPALSALAVAALAAMVALMPWHGGFSQAIGYGLASLCAATVVAALVTGGEGPLRAALRRPWLVGLGRLSYSLYIWHYPIFLIVWLNAGLNQTAVWPFIPVAWLAALLSFRHVEQPCMALRHRLSPQGMRRLGAGALAGTLAAMAAAALLLA